MSDDLDRPVGKHVKFSEGDDRPYVSASDLFTSEQFKKAARLAQKVKQRSERKQQEHDDL